MKLPDTPYLAWRLDFGPDFKKGIVANEPPKMTGKPFPILVPQVDRDGNETAGLRLPEQSVPLGTYTGWNMRSPSIGAPDVMYTQVGSFIPFARTKAEREQAGDPRSPSKSATERRKFLEKVKQAAQPLVKSGCCSKATFPMSWRERLRGGIR